MSNATPVWAAWSDRSVLIFREGADRIERWEVPRRTPADLRYFVKLFGLTDGRMLLRSGSHDTTAMDISVNCSPFEEIERWPVQLARLPPYRVHVTQTGTVAAIDASTNEIVLWSPPESPRVRTPPPGFSMTDVAEESSRLWICGSTPSKRLHSVDRRAAFAFSDDDGASWEVVERTHGGVLTTWSSVLSGAISSYRSISVNDGNILLTAVSGGLGHETTYLFLRTPDGRWRSKTLRNDLVRATVPGSNEGVRIVSHFGRMLQFDRETEWRIQDLRPVVLQLLEEAGTAADANVRIEILDAQASTDQLLIVVSLRSLAPERRQRYGEAVVILGANRSRLVAFHAPDEPEVISATWANACP